MLKSVDFPLIEIFVFNQKKINKKIKNQKNMINQKDIFSIIVFEGTPVFNRFEQAERSTQNLKQVAQFLRNICKY